MTTAERLARNYWQRGLSPADTDLQAARMIWKGFSKETRRNMGHRAFRRYNLSKLLAYHRQQRKMQPKDE